MQQEQIRLLTQLLAAQQHAPPPAARDDRTEP
jgi:hypothetical protein